MAASFPEIRLDGGREPEVQARCDGVCESCDRRKFPNFQVIIPAERLRPEEVVERNAALPWPRFSNGNCAE